MFNRVVLFELNKNHDSRGRFASMNYMGAAANPNINSKRPAFMKQAKVMIPPAWKHVHIAKSSKDSIWVRGVDVKGRSQRIYNPKFSAKQAASKFSRVKQLDAMATKVESKNQRNLKHRDASVRDSAAALHLIMKTGIRPGSDRETGGAKQAYGATTLQGRHVKLTKTGLKLQFTGKKGVKLSIPVYDVTAVSMLKQRAKSAGATGKLFPGTSANKLLKYTHEIGGSFKPKDFRTLLANRTASEHAASIKTPRTPEERKKAMTQVAVKVATVLGNTPSIALKSYIDPNVFHAAWGH